LADESPEADNHSPQTLAGTSVRLNLLVPDPDGLAERAIVNGAREISPIADQDYGLRQGRLFATADRATPCCVVWRLGATD
jgi:PhnB protein